MSPCIDSDSDLSQCTNCVTEFVSDNNILSDGGENENNNDDSNNATTTTAFCNNIQTEVCRGVATCGDSCGLITSNGENGKVASFLQFGSSCETLFLDLVICALESQNIGEDCSMETCAANGTAVGSSSVAPSLSLSAVITVAWVTAVTSISFFWERDEIWWLEEEKRKITFPLCACVYIQCLSIQYVTFNIVLYKVALIFFCGDNIV